MEIARWLRTCEESVPDDAQRIYLGHESCIDRMPSLKDMMETLQRLNDLDRHATLVTPFLTEKEMGAVCNRIESVAAAFGRCEVVCNDWGLLQWLTESDAAEPVVGRLLVGQATDPRLAAFDLAGRQLAHERMVRHADGTAVSLRYRRPSDALMTHLSSCAIETPAVLSFLKDLGVRRYEVSNLLQGLEIKPVRDWHVTLHLPEVPVAIARHGWRDRGSKWLHASFPLALCHRDNMVFYCNHRLPENIQGLGIDRFVYPSR